MLSTLADCVFDRWSPTIGDPSVMGWVTVAAYGATALLVVMAFRRFPERGIRLFGVCLALLLAALMVNKQLDLQSALTATGRCLSQMQGWYEDRRMVQAIFIMALLLCFLCAGLGVFWVMRRHLGALWLMLFGVMFLLAFVAVRAVGFHHFDAIINTEVNNVRMNWVLELGGLVMIAINSVWLLSRHRKAS